MRGGRFEFRALGAHWAMHAGGRGRDWRAGAAGRAGPSGSERFRTAPSGSERPRGRGESGAERLRGLLVPRGPPARLRQSPLPGKPVPQRRPYPLLPGRAQGPAHLPPALGRIQNSSSDWPPFSSNQRLRFGAGTFACAGSLRKGRGGSLRTGRGALPQPIGVRGELMPHLHNAAIKAAPPAQSLYFVLCL